MCGQYVCLTLSYNTHLHQIHYERWERNWSFAWCASSATIYLSGFKPTNPRMIAGSKPLDHAQWEPGSLTTQPTPNHRQLSPKTLHAYAVFGINPKHEYKISSNHPFTLRIFTQADVVKGAHVLLSRISFTFRPQFIPCLYHLSAWQLFCHVQTHTKCHTLGT